jgi:hypothetical protein
MATELDPKMDTIASMFFFFFLCLFGVVVVELFLSAEVDVEVELYCC